MKCSCCEEAAKVKVAKTRDFKCIDCFLNWFEEDVHNTIMKTQIFTRGERIALGVSGGKDSTVLAFVLNKLNRHYDYGLDIVLICIDEGIRGYRDDSIREARKTESDLGLPMDILSYKSIYGWTMDDIVARIGKKNNCTFCGVFRRQALDRGALQAGAVKLVTGHNADDLAETVLMNVLRGDVARLQRMAAYVTPGDATTADGGGALPRVKPLRYSYEKDIVMYAHFRKLNYFSTECIYAPNSYRGNARTLIKDLERERPAVILALVFSGESIRVRSDASTANSAAVKMPTLRRCEKCTYVSSQRFCKACLLLYGLNNGDTTVGTSSRKGKVSIKIMMDENNTNERRRRNGSNLNLNAASEDCKEEIAVQDELDDENDGDAHYGTGGCASGSNGGCSCQNSESIQF